MGREKRFGMSLSESIGLRSKRFRGEREQRESKDPRSFARAKQASRSTFRIPVFLWSFDGVYVSSGLFITDLLFVLFCFFLTLQLASRDVMADCGRARQSVGRARHGTIWARGVARGFSKMRAHSAGRRKSKMARRSTNRKQQGNVLKQAWEWADHTEPENITRENVESAYRVNTTGCSPGSCRWYLIHCLCFYRSVWHNLIV